jgi:hypothetical protein
MTNGDKNSNGPNWVRLVLGAMVLIGVIGSAIITSKSCGGNSNENNNSQKDVTYTGRVTDTRNLRPIKGAAVIVFTGGEKKETFTGDSGAFSFTLSPVNRTARLTVQANGYIIYDNPVFPLTKQDLEDVRLNPTVGEVRLNLPEGTKLKDAIKYAASKDSIPFGVTFLGNCNAKLMQSQMTGGDEFHGKDMGDIIGQFKFRLVNPPTKASYNVTKIEEKKVYQIECTN